MRIMGLTRGDADSEANVPPTPELMARMGELMEEVAKFVAEQSVETPAAGLN